MAQSVLVRYSDDAIVRAYREADRRFYEIQQNGNRADTYEALNERERMLTKAKQHLGDMGVLSGRQK